MSLVLVDAYKFAIWQQKWPVLLIPCYSELLLKRSRKGLGLCFASPEFSSAFEALKLLLLSSRLQPSIFRVTCADEHVSTMAAHAEGGR